MKETTSLLKQGRGQYADFAPNSFWSKVVRSYIDILVVLLLISACFAIIYMAFNSTSGSLSVAHKETANAQKEIRIRDEVIDDLRSDIDLLEAALSDAKTHLTIYKRAYEQSYDAGIVADVLVPCEEDAQ